VLLIRVVISTLGRKKKMDKISILLELSNLTDISLILGYVFTAMLILIAIFAKTPLLDWKLIIKKMYKIIFFLLALSMSISLALWMIDDTSSLWKYQFFAGTGLLLLLLLFY
jgi:hypothetical protein